jgi:hypothetical protein
MPLQTSTTTAMAVRQPSRKRWKGRNTAGLNKAIIGIAQGHGGVPVGV